MLKTLIKIRLKGLLMSQTKSSKKKASSLGRLILILFLFAYVGVVATVMFGLLFSSLIEPLQLMGIQWLYFAIMSLMIIILCFVGSVFIVHHEIYEAKDNELLLAMPIRNRDILLSRVFTILILNYIFEILVAGPAFYVYITNIGMNVIQILMFIGVFMTLPLFILALSCLFSWILAHVMIRTKMRNFISIAFFVVFMMGYFYAIGYIEEYMTLLIQHGKTIAEAIERSVYPLYHLSIALYDGNVMSFMIYLVCAIVPFGIVIYLLSTNFIKMATTKPKIKREKFKVKPMKHQSIKKALLVREINHFTSNAMVVLNGAIGALMSLMAAAAVLFYADKIKSFIGIFPGIETMMTPVLCMAVIGISSLNMISASSISLEGDRLWIMKSLPVSTKDILDIKLLLHFVLCVPAGIVLSLVLSFLFQTSMLDTIVIVVAPILFTTLIDLVGLLANLWKPKFDWVNETVCVKQSMPVMVTMFGAMGLVALIVIGYTNFCVDLISINMYMCLLIGISIVVNIALYYMVITWGVKRFNEL